MNSLSNTWINSGFTTDAEVDSDITEKHSKRFDKIVQISESADFDSADADVSLSSEDNYSRLLELVAYNSYPKKEINGIGLRTFSRGHVMLIGYVTEITPESFTAKLYEENNFDGKYEIGEFEMDDVDDGDLELLAIGAIFYWTFGHFTVRGQVQKKSEVRFQRIAPLDSDEFDDIIDGANDLNKLLTWE